MKQFHKISKIPILLQIYLNNIDEIARNNLQTHNWYYCIYPERVFRFRFYKCKECGFWIIFHLIRKELFVTSKEAIMFGERLDISCKEESMNEALS